MSRRAALALSVLLAALGASAAAAPPLAHPTLKRSSPQAGDSLPRPPQELRLTFSEAVETGLSSVRLLRADGGALALPSPTGSAQDPTTLTVSLPEPLPPGSYTVAWQIAGADGHPVRGRFTFVVLQSARVDTAPSGPADEPAVDTTPPAGAAGPATHHPGTTFPDDGRLGVESPAYVAIRWVGFSALLVIIGVVGLEYLVTRAVRRRGRAGSGAIVQGVRGRSAVIGAAAAGVLIATAGARAIAQFAVMREPGGAEGLELLSRILLRTTWGWGWLLQVAAAIAALATFLRMRRSPDRGWPLALTAALVLAVTPALAGHAAAVEGYGPLPILTDALHVLGAGGWLGTLFALLLAGLPAAVRLGNRDASAVVAELVNAFSPAALLFAGVAATTGVFAAWLHLGTLPAVWQSTYGRTLLLKLVVLSGAAATGFYNWRRVRPALGDEVAAARLRRSSTVELLIALAVLLVTAVLVATPPPGEAG